MGRTTPLPSPITYPHIITTTSKLTPISNPHSSRSELTLRFVTETYTCTVYIENKEQDFHKKKIKKNELCVVITVLLDSLERFDLDAAQVLLIWLGAGDLSACWHHAESVVLLSVPVRQEIVILCCNVFQRYIL